jgi:hypothetical protein
MINKKRSHYHFTLEVKTLTNRADLKRYREVERLLKRFFLLFGNLCSYCFSESMAAISSGIRPNKAFCCCLIDNQVHDHWEALREVQEIVNGPNWVRAINENSLETGRRRLPGNGPCKALCSQGCLLSSMRPPGCSTLVCSHMVFVLCELKLIEPRDIEDCEIDKLLGAVSPLEHLYGLKRGDTPSEEAFIKALLFIESKFRNVPNVTRNSAIKAAQKRLRHQLQGGKKR